MDTKPNAEQEPGTATVTEREPELSRLIEEVAERTLEAEPQELAMASGRTVVAEEDAAGERLVVRSPSGEVELQIAFNEQGPVLRFRSAELALESKGAVDVDCDRFRVRAKRGIEHRTGGNLKEVVDGNRSSVVRKSAKTIAHEVAIESARGNVDITANDDFRVLAERVKLNCE